MWFASRIRIFREGNKVVALIVAGTRTTGLIRGQAERAISSCIQRARTRRFTRRRWEAPTRDGILVRRGTTRPSSKEISRSPSSVSIFTVVLSTYTYFHGYDRKCRDAYTFPHFVVLHATVLVHGERLANVVQTSWTNNFLHCIIRYRTLIDKSAHARRFDESWFHLFQLLQNLFITFSFHDNWRIKGRSKADMR